MYRCKTILVDTPQTKNHYESVNLFDNTTVYSLAGPCDDYTNVEAINRWVLKSAFTLLVAVYAEIDRWFMQKTAVF